MVHTYDFHEQRVITAREEFESHGLSKVVTVQQRDVCKEGFGNDVEHRADAVFLDLPHPWLVVSHAVTALKLSGMYPKFYSYFKRVILLLICNFYL